MDNQPYRDSISARLSGLVASNTTQGTFTTGSFAFTESEIRTIIANWLDLADSYAMSIDKAFFATKIDGPGLDFASHSFATTANRSGETLVDYLERNRDYCLEQARLSQNALDDYLGVERTNVTQILEARQGPQPKV